MNLIRMGIRRPVAMAMIYLVIASLGIYFLTKLPLEQLPNVNLPSLTISTTWQFATPEMVEAFVTSPIEGVANTLRGVKEVGSTSSEGTSRVDVQFLKGTDIDFAMMELNEKLTILQEDLPTNVRRPEVVPSRVDTRRIGAEQDRPLQYTMTGAYTLSFIREYAEKYIETPVKGLRYVSDVTLTGGRPRLIKIELDQNKAKLFGVSENNIRQVLNGLEVKTNAGYIFQGGTRYDVFIENTAASINDVTSLRVRNFRGDLVPITQIAHIIDGFDEPYSHYRINGNPLVSIFVEQKDGTNTLDFVREVEERIEELRDEFPPTLQIIKDYDPSVKVDQELVNIRARAIFCILIIFAVLYIFLRNLKVPILILSTIFFSELITIILFYAFDIGFNIMTIAGLALGFGMLVDSSIVVIDNIFRYKERGDDSLTAAEKGSREVFLPIIASVLTTSIVFIPFLYLTGDNRLIYVPLAMAVVFSLMSSVVVAFSFIPTYALKLFTESSESIQESIRKNKLLQFILGMYGRFIEYVIHKKYWTLATVLVLFAVSYFTYTKTSSSWNYGRGGGDTYISVSVRLPRGAELSRGDKIAEEFEDMTLGRDHIKKVTTRVLPERVYLNFEFTDEALETAFPYILKDELTAYAATFAGVYITVSGVGDYFSSGSFGSSGFNFTIRIYGYNYQQCGVIAENIGRQLGRHARVKNIDTKGSGYSASDIFESVVVIKRDMLSKYSMSVQYLIGFIDRHLRGGSINSRIKISGEQIKFAIKVKDLERFQLIDLENIVVSQPGGDRVRLKEVAEVVQQRTPVEIKRNKQQYQRVVGFEYRGPHQMGEKIVDAILENYGANLPPGYTLETGYDLWRIRSEEKYELWLIILLAVVLVYMTTASLYESLLHPLVIILTVPLALIGVYLTFFFAGQQFDRSAYIGVILLAGIVVNNSIILVDHINLLRKKGMALYPAVVQGCKDRIRPILMTSTTTIMGLLPLIAFSSATRNIGRDWYLLSLASIGGLLSATPLTLSVIPVLYIIFEEWRSSMRKQWSSIDS
ncbi:efflux RND transporter permease subunit [candidate division KSB1 bacterium]